MIVKFFRGGRTYNGVKSAFKYLLNERAEQGTAKVFKGNPDLTLNIIKNIKNKYKFSSGVISFEELIEDEKTLNEIIKEFEKTFFAGLNEDQYNVSYILHTDKNRTELHFIIPRVELTTGKAYNPYFVGKDFVKKDLFQDYINAKFNLSSPHKIEKQEATKKLNPNWAIKDRQKLAGQIDEFVSKAIKKKLIKNREDIIYFLEQEGFKITRKGKNYISVKQENMGKAIKLKGDYYAQTFGSIQELREQVERREREHIPTTPGEFENIKQKLNTIIQKQIEYNTQRYSKKLTKHRLRVREHKAMESSKMANSRDSDRDNTNNNNPKNPNNKLHGKLEREQGSDSIQLELGSKKINSKEKENANRITKTIRRTGELVTKIITNANERNRSYKAREQGVKTGNAELNKNKQQFDNAVTELNKHTKQISAKLGARIKAKRINMYEELEQFKNINLKDYLEQGGYTVDRNKSTRRSYVLKNNGETLIVSRNNDGHYIYFNPENNQDSGTIIDFIQNRTGKNLGQVRKTLRAYLKGYSAVEHLSPANAGDIKDYYRTESYFTKTWDKLATKEMVDWGDVRGISVKTLKQNANLKLDTNNNYCFPIYSEFGVTGMYTTDSKMQKKAFTKGSVKGIWANKKLNKNIKKIIITESPVDSLSLQELNKIGVVNYNEDETLHIATLGRMGLDAKNTIEKIFNLLPTAKVVIATDADLAGEQIKEELIKMAKNRENREVKRVKFKAKDANEYLQKVKEQNINDFEIKR